MRSLKFLVMFVGALFILLAFDSFSGDSKVWEKIGGFLISTIPGIFVMLLVYFLWCKEKILGVILIVVSIAMMIFIGVFRDFPKELEGMFIFLPIFLSGIMFLVFGENKQKGCCKVK